MFSRIPRFVSRERRFRSNLRTPTRVLAGGAAAFALAYLGFALTAPSIILLAGCFLAAGVGIGAVETAEHAAVATLAPEDLRGSSFGALAGIQSFGNVVASGLAGLLYTVVSPTAAFLFPVAAMVIAVLALAWTAGGSAADHRDERARHAR